MASNQQGHQSEGAGHRGRSQGICLFGGTFDPIHLGHIHIAQAAIDSVEIKKVIFLPCRQSPHKTGAHHASAQDRLEMCRIATASHDWAEVDDHDLKSSQPCYSWRTAEAIKARFPNTPLFWLMGTDQWKVLPKWNRPEHLASLVEFIVFARGEDPAPREGYRMTAIHGEHPASATEIRESAKNNLRTEWLDPAVSDYLRRHNLYGSNTPG